MFIHTFLVMGLIAILFQDAYDQAVQVDSMIEIIIAILTLFFTNGIVEAALRAMVVRHC
ncbi:hypothetical protein [Virgibacillus halotolerans]|uniref:hypothetical protein n=1 Tax=Virgibacillus halotolerans TaxID=1071053 RepID=UPI00195F82C4|nr:hypothetical protein [Virgibacillus halotolerans]